MKNNLFQWILSLLLALLLLPTLYFKFGGADESIYIFTTVGMEPWGRYGSGIVELIAGILVLFPSKRAIASILALGVISGALFFHLTSLGIVVQDDGGQLFIMALLVFVIAAILLITNRNQILKYLK